MAIRGLGCLVEIQRKLKGERRALVDGLVDLIREAGGKSSLRSPSLDM